jgi:thioredoxin reductase
MHGVLGNEGTPPGDLLARGRAEAAGYGVAFADATVDKVDVDGATAIVSTRDGALVGRAVVVATGLADDLPDIPGLAAQWGRRVLHCPYCHGWEVRDQRLGVLAVPPTGLHQAELVRQWSDDIVVFTAGLGPLDPQAEQRLRALGIALVCEPVIEVTEEGEGIAVRTAGGRAVPVDAVFTFGTPRPRDGFLAHLHLARTDTHVGSFLAVDQTGRTSQERIWAVGNVVNPMFNVPMSIGAGAFTGGAVNGALVTEDFDIALQGART